MTETTALRELTLFSGLGADARLFHALAPRELTTTTPPWIEPFAGEALPAYAERIAERIVWRGNGLIGGASFGGMVAAEIARQRGADGLILISSARSASEIVPGLRLSEPLLSMLPGFVFERLGAVANPLYHKVAWELGDEGRAVLRQMQRETPVQTLRRGASMVVEWEGIGDPGCPVYRIHGDRDRVIRCPGEREVEIVRGAGHLLTLTHTERVNAFLDRAARG